MLPTVVPGWSWLVTDQTRGDSTNFDVPLAGDVGGAEGKKDQTLDDKAVSSTADAADARAKSRAAVRYAATARAKQMAKSTA